MSAAAARHDERLACVLLAAGGSRRLGTPKQLVRLRSKTLLHLAVERARAALPRAPIIVVVGAHALRLRLLVRRTRRGAVCAVNARWAQGLATSLAVGIATVPRDTEGVLVLLTDQPGVDARALRRLAAAWRRRPGIAAAAEYSGRLGVPAILPRRSLRAMRAMDGDSGARTLLRAARHVTRVAMPEAELDVDTPEDLRRLR